MPYLEQKRSLIESLIPKPAEEWVAEATPVQKAQVLSLIGPNFIANNITSVWAINNYYLEAMYTLKKEELICRYGPSVGERLLLHVTKEDAVDSIISDNFEWSRVKRSRFGLGTSFSDDAVYCHRFSNFRIGHARAIIVTKVLISKCKPSQRNELVPPPEYDTCTGHKDKVFVKFCDNEFLPVFVAFYNVSNVNPADVSDDYERSVHVAVLEGVNKYLQRFPDGSRPPVPATIPQQIPRQLVSPNRELESQARPVPPQDHYFGGRSINAISQSLTVTDYPVPATLPQQTPRQLVNPNRALESQGQPVTSQDHYSGGRGINESSVSDTNYLVPPDDESEEPINCCSEDESESCCTIM